MNNNKTQNKILPKHIGIIMDGNRRWAKAKHLPVFAGHSQGAETFKKIVLYCNKIGLENLSVYAFSTENWKRSEAEVSALMLLFKRYINKVIHEFKEENVKIRFIGDMSRFSKDIKDGIEYIESETKNHTGLSLNIAMNYGGKDEIVNATKNIVKKAISGEIKPEQIDESAIQNELYTKNIPDLDLIIRTAGEQRISNFMLWKAAYAEFYFSDILWPDFSPKDFDKAINEYFNRTRKFGGQ